MERMLTWMTGAQGPEIKKTVYSFWALFFLLFSYYLIKPLRTSQFLKEFSPDILPLFFLIIPILSYGITKIFNHYYDRINKYTLIYCTYGLVIGCKIFFYVLFPYGGQWLTILFFFWATIYFLLAIAIIWGCINDFFTSNQGERCFSFIAIGSLLGSSIGSWASELIAVSTLKDHVLLISALAMLVTILFLQLAVAAREPDLLAQQQSIIQKAHVSQPTTASRTHFFSDLYAIWQQRYVRCLAVIVYGLAVMNTVVEFQGQKIFDTQLSQHQYQESFAFYEKAWEESKTNPDQPKESGGYAFVYHLKQIAADARPAAITQFLAAQQLAPLQAQFLNQYQEYREQLEAHTRELLSHIAKYQGFVGIILLFFFSRPLFNLMGLRTSVMILPVVFLAVGVMLLFHINLWMMEMIQIVTYAINYSLNKTAKEILYTITPEETKFKLKPLIEGPVMRFGDISTSLFRLMITYGLVLLLGFPQWLGEWFFIAGGLLVTGYWLTCVWYAGGIYDSQKTNPKVESVAA